MKIELLNFATFRHPYMHIKRWSKYIVLLKITMTIDFLAIYEVSKVQWFGKSNPLAELPVQPFYYVQRA